MPECPDMDDMDLRLRVAEALASRLLSTLENKSLWLCATDEANGLADWVARQAAWRKSLPHTDSRSTRSAPRCALCETLLPNGYGASGLYCSDEHAELGHVLADIEDKYEQAQVGECLECGEPIEDKRDEFCSSECREDFELREQGERP